LESARQRRKKKAASAIEESQVEGTGFFKYIFYFILIFL